MFRLRHFDLVRRHDVMVDSVVIGEGVRHVVVFVLPRDRSVLGGFGQLVNEAMVRVRHVYSAERLQHLVSQHVAVSTGQMAVYLGEWRDGLLGCLLREQGDGKLDKHRGRCRLPTTGGVLLDGRAVSLDCLRLKKRYKAGSRNRKMVKIFRPERETFGAEKVACAWGVIQFSS